MKLHAALYFVALSLAAALLLVPTHRAAGCAVAPRPGESVQMADESAIILWDAASKTEHFIRRASFLSSARNFGFLVPTPTKPELAEAGDEAFATLADLTKPKIVTQPRPSGGAGGGCGCGGGSAPKSAAGLAEQGLPSVAVLDSKRVAGYDAVVLEADDADALGKWLKEHGYESSPAITEWVAPYVKAKWKISAFKVARDDVKEHGGVAGTARSGAADTARATDKADVAPPAVGQLATAAVRMTFHTERPFFPYREPPNQAKGGPAGAGPGVPREDGKIMPPLGYAGTPGPSRRLLRVYFLAEGRVKAALGEGGKDWSSTTNARVVWANQVAPSDREKTLDQLKLPKDTPPGSWWLTEFEDFSSARPGAEDLYFSHDDNQAPVERPPEIQYVSADLPGCVMCYALALYLFLPRLARRSRRRARA
ncbi:MAG TPA: DUF2330 domain-containing protein [Gemmataceae bacterium]|nr:DUF2330 domain-containing protein [Gemmataceae bacterium]